ncbi:MAG: HNH endonuclease [Acidobacteriota bacterium]|nr:HNH endonuclease [Acidobacteriota bacterium]
MLTVVEGKKGQKPETEALIKRDKHGSARDIIKGGLKLVNDAADVLGNIYGGSPRSLMLMPLVYFYNEQGVPVRSLLYGMLYWLNHGSEHRDILDRKRLFSTYRAAFETVLLDQKKTIIKRISRRIGSGPEVTYQTARYFDGLLKLIIEHKGVADSAAFQSTHESLIETLGGSAKPEILEEITPSPLYKGRDRDWANVNDVFSSFQFCEICGGRYLPGLFTQVDHIKRRKDGGKTTLENARNTHPFCNNQRDEIEALRAGEKQIVLPVFEKPEKEQMSFLSLWVNEHEGDELDPVEEAEAAEIEEPDSDSDDDSPAS